MDIYVREPAGVAIVRDTGMKQDTGKDQSTLEMVAHRDRWGNGTAGATMARVLAGDSIIVVEVEL